MQALCKGAISKSIWHCALSMLSKIQSLRCCGFFLQVGQTAEALNAARAEVESAEKEAMAMKKKADDLTAAAGRKSAEADNYRDKWEKMKEQVSVAKSAEREHWERAKKVIALQ